MNIPRRLIGQAAILAVLSSFSIFSTDTQNGTTISQSPIEVKGQFQDYIRFTPNTSGSIYVTLGIVTWNLDGKIACQGSPPAWQLMINSTPDPVGPDSSDSFPAYTRPR